MRRLGHHVGIIAGVGGGIALLILILIVVMLQNKATPVAPTQPATTELAVVQTRQPPPDEPVTALYQSHPCLLKSLPNQAAPSSTPTPANRSLNQAAPSSIPTPANRSRNSTPPRGRKTGEARNASKSA